MAKPIAALWGLAGAFLATLLAVLMIDQFDAVQQGWFTFNAVLVAITFSGDQKMDGVYVLIGVLLAVLIEHFMMGQGLIFLTFPFIAASWLTLLIKNKVIAPALKA
jgi:urea transporter